MTDHDLTIQNTAGNQAVMVTITGLGTEGSEELADQAKRAIEQQFADEQVTEK